MLFAYWLAYANDKYPGVRIFAATQMGNHGHLVVQDLASDLSDFMMLFLGCLGKALNRLDRTRGQVFERRFDAIAIVDDDALVDRISYCVANPAQADLVTRHSDWPGVCAYGRADVRKVIRVQNLRQADYERACRRAKATGRRTGEHPRIDREAFTDRLELKLVSCGYDEDVRDAIEERETTAARARGNSRVRGSRRVARQNPFGAPAKSKRSPRPLCHAATSAGMKMFREKWFALVHAYREASAAFRAGDLQVVFPDYMFRPWAPLVEIA